MAALWPRRTQSAAHSPDAATASGIPTAPPAGLGGLVWLHGPTCARSWQLCNAHHPASEGKSSSGDAPSSQDVGAFSLRSACVHYEDAAEGAFRKHLEGVAAEAPTFLQGVKDSAAVGQGIPLPRLPCCPAARCPAARCPLPNHGLTAHCPLPRCPAAPLPRFLPSRCPACPVAPPPAASLPAARYPLPATIASCLYCPPSSTAHLFHTTPHPLHARQMAKR